MYIECPANCRVFFYKKCRESGIGKELNVSELSVVIIYFGTPT
jgi:hypothetical protein